MRQIQNKRNFSAKREAIFQELAATDTHPSAEWVYERLKEKIPGLSLGTVYRNLSVFKEMGIARSVGIFNGQERFDANVSYHPHFVCKTCFRIIDLPKGFYPPEKNLYRMIERDCGVSVDDHAITFYGLCHECNGI